MKKVLLVCMFIASAVYADYTNRLPSITLAGGDNQTHKAIADCSSVWQCTFGYRPPSGGYDFTYTTNGNVDSTLTLNVVVPPNSSVQDKTIPFYINNATINPRSNLILNDFDSILLESKMSIDNASLTFNANKAGNTTNFQINSRASVVLSNNATLKVVANDFLNKNIVSISNSTLDITATSILSYNEMQNDNGTITINGSFYNVGQKMTLSSTSSGVANLINNGGTITITGIFLNGGQSNPQYNDCRLDVCGGGNIINKGGIIDIKGQLISQGEDGQLSTIQLYGGTLIVGGGLQNKEGSTLIFGIGNNGKMGELQGNLANDKGIVAVDIDKITLGQSYKIINGAINGLNNNDIQIINPNSQFFSSVFDNTNGTLTIKQATNANGETKFDEYKKSLNTNSQGILNALSSKFGGDDTLLTSGVNLENAVTTTEKVLKESFIAQPQGMINALQANALPLPTPKSIAVAKRTAASEIIRFDNGKRVSSFERKLIRAPKHRSVYFNPLGAILRADNLKGYIAGFTLGTSYEVKNYTSQIYFSYAYGASSQDFTTQSADTTGNLFQAGFLNRYSYSVFEMAMNANVLAGVFKIKNEWQDTTMLNSTANFGDYQLNLGLIVGAKLGKKLSFKPFVGIQNYLEMREKFKQNGGLEIESKGYNAYIIDGVLGVEARYVFNEFASVFGKFSFEDRLYNTHKTIFMWALGNELKYDNKSYDNALSLNLGTQIYTWYDFNLDAELSYKHYNNGLNYFGGNLILKYSF